MARPWRPEPEVLHAIHNIFGVARYERMLLLRTTRFRILGSVGVVLPLLIGIGLAVLEARGIEFSSALGMGALALFEFALPSLGRIHCTDFNLVQSCFS